MGKIITVKCPKCNSHSLYKYGKDKYGNQKYQCRCCKHQFAPDFVTNEKKRKYPSCPKCGKGSLLHHAYEDYSNYRCNYKRSNHSFFVFKPTVKLAFAPLFNNLSLFLMPSMDFNSDEWHTDETVIKIECKKHYILFIIDSETRFVLGFHLSPQRDSIQAFSLLNAVKPVGSPKAIVSDRYSSYKVPIKSIFDVTHICVESFKDDISNNLIESFNKQFKAWYKTKQGFNSFDSANNLISMFVFFFNFIRPHSALSGLTPAQVAGCAYSKHQQNMLLLVS